jgi:hypothetical protein
MKKGVLAHGGEGAAEFIPTLQKHVDMLMEATAMLVMDKCLGQCGAKHVKEQEAAEATRCRGSQEDARKRESLWQRQRTRWRIELCTRGSRWPGRRME